MNFFRIFKTPIFSDLSAGVKEWMFSIMTILLLNMKKLILILLSISLTFNGLSQKYGAIEGIVYDSIENAGIAYVSLSLIKSNLQTFSDNEGKFIFNNVPVGEDIFECSTVGYGTPRRLTIKIFADSTSFIKINLAPCQYDTFGARQCPICNKTDVTIPIVYGDPTKKGIKLAKKGEIKLGGCVISHCDPKWYCKRDGVSF